MTRKKRSRSAKNETLAREEKSKELASPFVRNTEIVEAEIGLASHAREYDPEKSRIFYQEPCDTTTSSSVRHTLLADDILNRVTV